MKLWRQRQEAKGKGKGKAISTGIGSASLGDLTLRDASDPTERPGRPSTDSVRPGLPTSSSSRVGFPSLGSDRTLAPPIATRTRAISAPKLRPKTWVSQLIAAANTAGEGSASGLETTSQAAERARAQSSPRPVPVSTLVLCRDNDDSDRAQAEEALRWVEAEAASDAALARRGSASGGSALSSVAHSQFSKSAPSLPLTETITRYQDNGALDLLPPLTPVAEPFPVQREPESPLVIRNLDEAPRGAWTPAIDPPASTNLPGPSRLRNPWEARSEEDDLVEEAVASSRSTHKLAVEEEAVLSMLDAMGRQAASGHATSSRPPPSPTSASSRAPTSPASQYSTAFKSPAPSEASQFSQASGESEIAAAPATKLGAVKDAVREREELDRAASASSGANDAPNSASTGWLARGSALRKKASSYFSAIGFDVADENEAGGEAVDAAVAGKAIGTDVATAAPQQLRPPMLSRQTTSAAHYDRGGPRSGDSGAATPASRHGVFARMQQEEQESAQRPQWDVKRPELPHRGSKFSTSSSIGGGLYGRPAVSPGGLLSPTSPMDGSLISSQDNATSLWSRPAHAPDTPNTSHDPRSPNHASVLSRWNSSKFGAAAASTARPGYSLDPDNAAGPVGSSSSILFPPKFRRQTTNWTDATSVASHDADGDFLDKGRPTVTVTVTAATSASGSSVASNQDSQARHEAVSTSDAASRSSRRAASQSDSSAVGSAVACKSVRSGSATIPPSSADGDVAEPSVFSSRLSRQADSVGLHSVAAPAAPLSPMPSSPTKAKDLIRFFETAGSATPTGSPKPASNPPSPTKVSLRTAKKILAEPDGDAAAGDALQVTPKRLVFPLGASNSNPSSATAHDSPLTLSSVSPLAAKLRAGGVAGRTRLRSRMVAAGGAGLDGGLDDADFSDEENMAPSSEATPVRVGAAARRRLSGSSTSTMTRATGVLRPPLASAFALPNEGHAIGHVRSGSSPAPLSSSLAVGTAAQRGLAGPSYRQSGGATSDGMAATTAAGGSVGKRSGGGGSNGGSGFPFRSSVRSIVNAIAGRNVAEGPSPSRSAVDKPKKLKKAVSTGWDYTKEPWEAQQADAEAARKKEQEDEAEEKDDSLSVASRMTLGTIASFRHTVERGQLPESAASAIELSGEPSSTPPVRSGVLFYFNVHHRDPHWQRVQVVLLPSAVAMSWIPAGGGRENVVLDLRACREVHSVPGPEHPSSTSDIGATCARKQGLGRLSPFQLIFDDGVERLAAESAMERVKWVNSIWDVTGVSPRDRPDLSEAGMRPAAVDLNELRWPDPAAPSSRREPLSSMPREATHTRSRTESAIPAANLGPGRSESTASPRRTLPASRSTNTMEAIDRIGSIWKSELSSEADPRECQPSIAEALATGPPVPPKDPEGVAGPARLAPAISSSALGRRQKVRSWRKMVPDEEGAADEGFVHDSAAKMPTMVQSPQQKVKSQPASFADDFSSDKPTLAGTEEIPPRQQDGGSAGREPGNMPDTAAPTELPEAQDATGPTRAEDVASLRVAELDAPPDDDQGGAEAGAATDRARGSDVASLAEVSPDLDGYESAHSHPSQVDEFGPRTPVSEAVFNWSRPKQDGEIRPSDSASQRPARSEFGTITSRVSMENRQAKAASATAPTATVDDAAPKLTEASLTAVAEADDRTPAQRIRDKVLGSVQEPAAREALAVELDAVAAGARPEMQPALAQTLGTVIEETQSQAQSTRASRQQGHTPILTQLRDGSEVDEVIASSDVIRQSLKSPSAESRLSKRTASTSYSQDVHRLLEHLEEQQRAHMEREKLMEDQIRGFQDVIAGLQTKSANGSIRSGRSHRRSSASTAGESRSTSKTDRDSELAAMQEKLDSLHNLVANMVTSQSQRNLDAGASGDAPPLSPGQSRSELARIESMLEKLMRHHASASGDAATMPSVERSRSIVRDAVLAREPSLVHEWDQLPPELRGAELMRSMEERARFGRDGRHEAIAQDLLSVPPRRGSAPPMAEDCGSQATPRANLETPRPDGLRPPSRASMAASVSMTDLDSVAGRVPARSWISADGIPSPPPNSEWDAVSIRSRRIFTPPTAGISTPAQNLRIHGDPNMGATMPTPRPALGPAQPSVGSVDMEAEIRKRRARQQAANGTGSAQPGGWYTPKVPLASAETGADMVMGNVSSDPQRASVSAAAADTPRATDQRGGVGIGTPAVPWAPGGPARDPGRPKAPGEDTPSGLGLSLARNANSGSFEGQRSQAAAADRPRGPQQPEAFDVRKLNVSSKNPELATILEALKQSEAARELQVRQQGELARYVNELHSWLEKDVAERSKEFRILATGVTQLHDELLATKRARPLPPTHGLPPAGLSPTNVPPAAMAAAAMGKTGSASSFGPRAMSRESSGQTATATGIEGLPPSSGMPIPIVTLGDASIPITGPPVGPNPHDSALTGAAPAAASAPPTMLRPGGSALTSAAPPGVAPHITFGNGGKWTNLQTPNLDNGFTTPVRTKRQQKRTWHANTPAGPRKPEEAWYKPDDAATGDGSKPAQAKDKAKDKDKAKAKRPTPLKSSSYISTASASSDRSAKKFVAAAGGALLVRAALTEWEAFKMQQRAEGKPEDPIPAGASGDPELDQRLPLPEPIASKLRDAAEACDQEGVTSAVRDAAQVGLGTQAIIKLSEHVERLEGNERAAAAADAEANDGPLDGDTLAPSEVADRSVGMPTPSPHKTRFADVPEEIGSVKTTSSSLSTDMRAVSNGGPSTGALALAVEEILKHLLERKEEEKKRAAQVEAAKAKKEAEKRKREQTQQMTAAQQKEAEKAELVDMILSRLGQEKSRQEAELVRQQRELDPKSAIESLVTMLNSQRENDRASQASADRAIKEMASSLLRTTTEQNGKLVEAVNSAAREMLKHNINAHADELKRQLSKEVAVMFEDVGKIREAKRALEHEIADLFAIKSRHLTFDAHGGGGGMNLGMPMPMPVNHAPAQIAPYYPPGPGPAPAPAPVAPPQQPQAQPWLPPHAYALGGPPYYHSMPPPGQDAAPTKTRSAPKSGGSKAVIEDKSLRKAAKQAAKAALAAKVAEMAGTAAAPAAAKASKASKAAKAAPPAAAVAPAAAAAPAATPAAAVKGSLVPALLGGGKDILNPFSINFGPRAPR
ncbi:uncharacterized protein PFL1_06175 [Pseudozyma flocculosa PF-1]|uniref:PH domain-containing protein n=2 Tax=Pseudozyma flocculosa TaxID=84751 RepID=A0A5C3FA44_9BASI|nr:uncharacterized protein PFL1_06175 [Pseudozyma flocculosa PF-1]EPQ26240.1 hypothetical protein PFL1_06175 [Pseudozyma flocculosa PF-1]SPO40199.1 uncharacterized protein PSFLO_05681 [Pseudozyma flocculosa]